MLLSALSEFSHFVHSRQFLGQICKIFLYKRHFHIQRQKVIFNEFSNGRASKVEHHSPFELRILKNFSSSLRRMFFFVKSWKSLKVILNWHISQCSLITYQTKKLLRKIWGLRSQYFSLYVINWKKNLKRLQLVWFFFFNLRLILVKNPSPYFGSLTGVSWFVWICSNFIEIWVSFFCEKHFRSRNDVL